MSVTLLILIPIRNSLLTPVPFSISMSDPALESALHPALYSDIAHGRARGGAVGGCAGAHAAAVTTITCYKTAAEAVSGFSASRELRAIKVNTSVHRIRDDENFIVLQSYRTSGATEGSRRLSGTQSETESEV
ncbi:hypothetical protein EVAR_61911_1 [Eumeta japonica]|uniref:Uncharacterized protein n=1 Tax=Eumeta variegata TaxID=151549 RepID=A0A4C1YIM8_EUMVA|nr:hypothetical protein EVAR_61911_1 [Eumeta japonica]